ncbi:MAG: insulinase family protein, partial [Gemmatimonadetes bacterium]|nr:insulinase family protein [Gemmatimonadota bacterium]
FEHVERAGGALNGSTWFDRTNYYETLPSHFLDLGLWLEADRMGFMLEAMTQEKLDNQRDVVKNEKRQRYDNQPYGDWDEHVQRLLWPDDHPYHHTVIGSMEDLDAASLDDVAEFFRAYYIPNNAVLTVAGDAEPERVFAAAERWFGEIPAGPPPPPIPGRVDVAPVLGRTERVELERDVPLPRIVVGLRIPPFTDSRFDAVDLAAQILGQGRSSRLYRSLVREKRIARDASAYALPLVTGGSTFLAFVTGFPDSDVAELEAALFEELDAMSGVTPAEVERGRVLAEAREVRGLESMAHRADLLSMYTTFFDEPERLNATVERIRTVNAEQIRDVARDFFGADNRAVIAYVPAGGDR